MLGQEDGIPVISQGAKGDPNCFQSDGVRVARTNRRPDAEDAEDG